MSHVPQKKKVLHLHSRGVDTEYLQCSQEEKRYFFLSQKIYVTGVLS